MRDDSNSLFGPPALRRPFHGYERCLSDRMLSGGAFSQAPSDVVGTPAAGWTYFGQFLNHDLTGGDPAQGVVRSPVLNLDCLYGHGPGSQDPWYFDGATNYGFLKIGRGENFFELDLPRDGNGVALIADKRNDQSVLVSQVHLGFLLFHDRLWRSRRNDQGWTAEAAFVEAQRLTRWHYQWLVVNRFLPQVMDRAVLDAVHAVPGKPDLQYFDVRHGPHVPIEFSLAAFRFGHSMARERYSLNATQQDVPLFIGTPSGGTADDLRGGRKLPRDWSIQWDMFLPDARRGAAPTPQMAMAIDTAIATPMGMVPDGLGGTIRLPEVTLRQGFDRELPCGQDVALHMKMEPLDKDCAYPLFLYILLEAERAGGIRLGPVGSRIVVEVLLGLLMTDKDSYLYQKPDWKPTEEVAGADPDSFDLIDVFRFAGMPISAP